MREYIELITNVINEATYEYDKNKRQPALMTWDEYIVLLNPRDIAHADDAYNVDIKQLNRNYESYLNRDGGAIRYRDHTLYVYTNGKTSDKLILALKNSSGDTHFAIIFENVLYYDPLLIDEDKAMSYTSATYHQVKEVQPTKYMKKLAERISVASPIEEYPKLIKRIQVRTGEYIEIRQGNDAWNDVSAFNEDGLRIAFAGDEWGAILIQVAKEYQGLGIGTTLSKIYFDMFPEKESGGLTPSGLAQVRKVWESEVRKFLANGIYSNLIRKGQLSKERLDSILSGLSKHKVDKIPFPTKKPSQKDKQYIAYYNGSNAFVLYDVEYLMDQNPKYIYAYLHLEQDVYGKVYVYRFDYEDDKDRQTLFYMALQTLTNEGAVLSHGVDGEDFFKKDDLDHVDINKDKYTLKKNMFGNVNNIFAKEKQLRRRVDKYNEVLYSLLEDAESKWK